MRVSLVVRVVRVWLVLHTGNALQRYMFPSSSE